MDLPVGCWRFLLLVTAVAACGGRSGLDEGSSSSSSSGGAPPGDGGFAIDAPWGVPPDGGAWSGTCPEEAPGEGEGCSSEGVYCEYGDAWWDVSCDTVVECADSVWQSASVSQETCFPAPGANPGGCPVSPSTIAAGTSCRVPGIACYYGQGAVCTCSLPGGPDDPDGGSEWGCGPDPGCPSARPRLGSPCTGDAICEYDDTSGFAEVCQAGLWGPSQVSN